MTTNAGNEVDTAVTVFADDSIKELLKSGKIEDVQKIVQEGQSSLPVTASGFIQFLLGFQHFLVDAICIACLWGPVTEFCGNTPQGWGMLAAFISLYNVLAFCTQWLTGLWCDFLKNDRIMHIVAAVALILGAAACRLLPLYGVILIALGNSLFHVAGGRFVILNSRGKAGPLGLFVAPGALGLYIGGIFNAFEWIFCTLLFINTVAICVRLLDVILPEEAKCRCPGKAHYLAAALVLICIICRAASGAIPFPGKNIPEILSWLPVLMVFAGKSLGGLAGDRWGYTAAGVLSLFSGALLLAFCSASAGYLAGQLLMNLLMPLTLWQLVKLIPESPGLAFGLAATVLVPGTWVRFSATPVNMFLLLSVVSLICFVLVQIIIKREVV